MQKTCIHAYGNSQVYSPNIDNLVKNGISFSHTYTNGALCGALSMPSRAMIMTGRGVYQISKDGPEIPSSHITLPELLRNNGYETFGTGKWHSDKKSFNRSFEKGDNIFFGGMHPYEQNGHVSPLLHHYDSECNYRNPFKGTKFSSEMYADAAINYLTSRGKKDKPFFAFTSIIETLRQNKELDNTIIVFASDNGLALGRHGLLGKQNLYDHSIGVPMLMVIPGMEKGVEKDVNCYLYDIYPTLCDLIGIKKADSVTGKSLLPVIEGKAKCHREQLFLSY